MSEISYQLNATLSPDDPRDFQADIIFPADLSLPKTHDPRKDLLDVRNQRVQGSCVAQSSACLKEIQEKKNIGFEEYMSPQFIYNNRINQNEDGMYSRDSMKILYKKGIVPEQEYPYGKIEKPENISAEIYGKALNYKISGYAFVNTVETCKAAIYRSGACIITVPVYHSGRNMWRPINVGDNVQGLHAMAMIGWNESGFIIRNSWGEDWATGGYTIFPYSDWGMHSEIWTLIDDESSRPDPKYSKWHWKAWRAVYNTFANMGIVKYTVAASVMASIAVAIIERPIILLWIPICSIGLFIYSWKKKLYLSMGDSK